MNESELLWQCRRGMRELDILLLRYLEGPFEQAAADSKQAFRELLALPDPALIDYLLHGQTPTDAGIADVVRKIRGDTPT